MPKVPLTDKEKQMRAEALRRFNIGGMFNIDQKLIDDAVARAKANQSGQNYLTNNP